MPFRFLKCLAVVAFIHVCAAMLVYGAYQLTRSDSTIDGGISENAPSDQQNYKIVDESAVPEDNSENVAIQPQTHVVKSGESYYSIAKSYDVNPNTLKNHNNSKQLHPGDTIAIP